MTVDDLPVFDWPEDRPNIRKVVERAEVDLGMGRRVVYVLGKTKEGSLIYTHLDALKTSKGMQINHDPYILAKHAIGEYIKLEPNKK